jgi:amino acid adenylation domain-containing protein
MAADARHDHIRVMDLVSAHATARPDGKAVVAGDEVLTYRELDARSTRLAHLLTSLGVGPDVIVGLCLERSAAMVVGALGIMKAGGAYLALDPAHPPERLAFMLTDAQAPVLVGRKDLAGKLPAGSWRLVAVDAATDDTLSEHPACRVAAHHLAYVIYTSGSSGQPKGVEITHGGLSNLIEWHQQAFAVSSSDRACLQSAPSFDASIWELWPYLASGASVHVPDEIVRRDPESLRDWLVANGVTICFVPSALAERMIALPWPAATPLRALLTGADVLRHHPRVGLPFVLVNNYGPTECTVVATSALVPPAHEPGALPTIGRPIANVHAHILDKNLHAVPVGTVGELYIGGAGVARGYLNRPEQTKERFVRDPFSPKPGARLYKTGDLASYRPDGQISFLGRADDQIQIRGYRIEPEEIVGVLNRHADVQASLVVARDGDRGGPQLVAYVVQIPDSTLTYSSLQELLRMELPAHMVPGAIVLLPDLPLTSNGKVDRASLPAPNATNTLRDHAYVAPRTPLEQRIAEVMVDLMRLDGVGVEDNFFLLGGHSLLGTQVIGRIRDLFAIELSLRSLFDHPTVAELSIEIEKLIASKLDDMSAEDIEHVLASSSGGGT